MSVGNHPLPHLLETPAELPQEPEKYIVAWFPMVIIAVLNLLAGRVWLVVPVWVAVSPYIFFRLQR